MISLDDIYLLRASKTLLYNYPNTAIETNYGTFKERYTPEDHSSFDDTWHPISQVEFDMPFITQPELYTGARLKTDPAYNKLYYLTINPTFYQPKLAFSGNNSDTTLTDLEYTVWLVNCSDNGEFTTDGVGIWNNRRTGGYWNTTYQLDRGVVNFNDAAQSRYMNASNLPDGGPKSKIKTISKEIKLERHRWPFVVNNIGIAAGTGRRVRIIVAVKPSYALDESSFMGLTSFEPRGHVDVSCYGNVDYVLDFK